MKLTLRNLLTILLTGYGLHAMAQDPKNFSFLTGSCAYLDLDLEDSTGVFYDGDTSIFYSMAQTEADFMIWLGDNWYLGRKDWSSARGLAAKAAAHRNAKVFERLKSRQLPEYAIWDDHDYGPNNGTGEYRLKRESRQVFMDTWKDNPGYGEDGEGIYTSFLHEGVRFILLDNRWWRSSNSLWDYRWLLMRNKDKRMLGAKQMDWLKRLMLTDSAASITIIVNGSQVLNPLSRDEGLIRYPAEYKDLLDFLAGNIRTPVYFLTGDRHFSEIIAMQGDHGKQFYDITVSPFTSRAERPSWGERRNPYRVPGSLITQHNYARIRVEGPVNARRLKAEFYDRYGRVLWTWEP